MNREQKRALIAESIKADPQLSNREHAKRIGVDDKTVGTVRNELESTAEIPQFDKTIGADGKERPASKPRAVAEPEPPQHNPLPADLEPETEVAPGMTAGELDQLR